MLASPLRYPGGKAAMAGLLSELRQLNGLGQYDIAEPFAGGAGASLELLFREDTGRIHINDADPNIHDFWWTLVHRPRPFLELLATKRISMAEWRRQREVLRSPARHSRLRRGFATFYLNRCNRSGIILNGGPIGGIAQTGTWKLGARYNRKELARRCNRVAEYGERIGVSKKDGVEFLDGLQGTQTFLFIDPPYYEKGPSLYLNALTPSYHRQLAAHLRKVKDEPWVLTYDDCPEIRRLYSWANIRPFSLRYAAAERRQGKELFISPQWMELPIHQSSKAIVW